MELVKDGTVAMDEDQQFNIIDVLRTEIGFEYFMAHLAKEFSMENLLAIIEFTQYKQRYRQIRTVQDEAHRKDSKTGVSKRKQSDSSSRSRLPSVNAAFRGFRSFSAQKRSASNGAFESPVA